MKKRIVKRVLAGCLAIMLLFGDTAGVLATERFETEAAETAEVAGDTESIEVPSPIHMAYFGLPSVLAPKTTASTSSAWQGDRITNFGYRDGQTFDTNSYTDTWKILDPSTGLLWADGIFVRTSDSNMDTVNATLADYLNKVADNDANVLKYDAIEKAAISEMRLLTKAEVMTETYGFHNTEDADAAKVIGKGGYTYSYLINNEGTPTWVDGEGTIGSYSDSNYCGYAPAIVLNTDKVFMTVYSDFYEYGGYAKTDISDTTSRSWNLLLHSGDTGFAATLPETAPYDGYYYVDVTGLGSLAYDKISMVFVDSEGDIAAYINSSYNEDTYLSKPTEGSFQFLMPTDLAVGTYTVKVFCENEDGAYDTGYVSNIVEGTVEVQGPMASNISVEQLYGQVNLYWEIANKRTEQFQTYTYCNIYRSVSRNGEYELVAANVPCDNSDDSYYWMDRSVSKLENSVENATYYYRIVTLSDSAECGGTEMVSSDVVTNEGLFYGVTGLESYIGAYIVNVDGEKISALTIHEGEALELGLALVKPNGTTEDVNSREMAEGTWYLHKEYSKTGECQNQEEVVADKLEICPYELVWEDGKIVLPAHKVYLQAGEDAEGLYYLTTEIKLQNGALFDWQIPVTIIAAEEGIDYEKCPDIIVQTKEEAEQKLRDFMVARDNESYVVVAPGVSVGKDTIFDIFAEREGMKPNEGDYLNYQVGYKDQTSFFWHPYESTRVEFNGHSYSAYYSTTPFITTAEEEAEVDAKINALVHTEGGALYEAAYGNTTDEEKVKAIYDWIVKNVNPSVAGDRTTPIYHTVYHTLFGAYDGYPGSGTCGAFAVLFTRLSREMGIASKVIMGTDAAAHAYNIVRLGQKWYFIDTNSKRYLADATEFERTQEQAHYLDQRFIDNYLSKIPGSDYEVESNGKAVVTNSLTSDRAEYEDIAAAVAYINEEAAKAGNETVEYTLTIIGGNMACPADGMNFIECGDRVTIDLGGYTLIVRDALHGGVYMGSAIIRAKYVHNGLISVGDDVSLALSCAIGEAGSLYENVDIVYESTIGTADHTGYLSINGGYSNKLTLADSVTIDKFFVISVSDNAEVNTNLNATNIELGTQMDSSVKSVINGKVTADKSCIIWGGKVEVDELISKKETQFYNAVATTVTVGKEISLGGMTCGDYTAAEPTKTIIELERHFTSAGDVIPTEQATFNWNGNVFNYYYNYESGKTPFPMFHITAKDYVNGVLQGNKAFSLGQTIGTIDVKGTNAQGETYQYNIPLTSANLSDYLTVEAETSEKVFVEIADKVLRIATFAVELSYADETGTKVVTSFRELLDAITAINTLKVKRDYAITLYEDCAVSAALTMPKKDFIKSLIVVGAGVEGVSKIKSNGKLTLTSDTVFKNITFDGTVAYTVAIGDYGLTIDGLVEFPGKAAITSGKKGSLIVTEEGQLTDVTTLKVTNFTNKGQVNADKVTLTTAYLDAGKLYANQTIQITNLTLEGKAVVRAEKDFKITGTLYSKTDEAVLYSRQNTKKVPYLNITGTVTLETPEDKVQVGVYAVNTDELTKMESGNVLLNVKTATADMFVPVADNVDSVGAYPVENGYFLQKNKTGIYVYYAGDVTTALYKDDSFVGYFKAFADAVTEIETRKDTKAEYSIVLLGDVNSNEKPAAVTLPSKAAKVTITSDGEAIYDIFYTGNITLKTHTEFENVCFNPMDKNKKGVASKFAAGKFDLTLRDVELGAVSGMAIKDIVGSKTQVTTLDSEGLVIMGSISGSKELVLGKSVTVKGSVKITDLTMQGGVTLDVAGAISVTNIYSNKNTNLVEPHTNAIYYGKNSKGVSNLVVNGVISGNNVPLALYYNVADADKTDYQLVMQSGKFTLNNKLALATMAKASLSEVKFFLRDAEKVEELSNEDVVKANKGIYVADVASNPNVVWLESTQDGIVSSSYCLDFSQAVNEINNAGSMDAIYEIVIGALSNSANVTDTNTTDKKTVSAITMPKKGKAASIKIVSADGESITYSGNISYPGVLEISNVELVPVGSSSISGTKNVSEVTLSDTDAVFKDIKNVKCLALDDATVKTTGTVTATDVVMSGQSHWATFGKTTVTNVDVSAVEAGSYIGVKQTAKTLMPMFAVSGSVTLNENGTPLAVKLYQPTATIENSLEITTGYKNVTLVIAPKESADHFVALPFAKENIAGNTEGVTSENLVAYKTIKNEVMNGNKAEMVIRIVRMQQGSQITDETYAKSFDEAVTIINNANDKTASYRMELLCGNSGNPLLTTKKGTVFGKMTLPSKAAKVTISGVNENSAIAYKGSLAANCDTVFDNVILLQDNEKNNLSISYSGGYELAFTDSAASEDNQDVLMFKSVKASKGTLTLDHATVHVTGAMSAKDLEIIGETALTVDGKIAVTNISGFGSNRASLLLENYFSTKNVTQLTINGNISDVELKLVPFLYEKETDNYHAVTEATVAGKQLAVMPKASSDSIMLGYRNEAGDFQVLSGGSLYKQNGGLYYTTESLPVEVMAEDASGNAAPQIYRSSFASWEYAVKEIDKRSDTSLNYRMVLKDDIGKNEPIKTLTLPAKAKEVTVTSVTGDENCVFFTDKKVTLKANTTFENVGLFAVKKVNSESGSAYETVTYNFAAGKFNLTWNDLMYQASERVWQRVGTISGNGKGTFTVLLGSEKNNNIFWVDKISNFATVNICTEEEANNVPENQIVNSGLVMKGMSGIGTLNMYPGTMISCDAGSVSGKNAVIRRSILCAKDITISNTVTLESATLEAGSDATGDGKLSLGSLILEDTENYLEAKVSSKGKSQLSISGTVTASPDYTGTEGESAIKVALLDAEGGAYVLLTEGMDVINAKKADAFWFVPKYTHYENEQLVEGMGEYRDGYGLYKAAKTIKYGSVGR